MGCGCRKKKAGDSRLAVDAASRLTYEVYVNGKPSGRRFTSLISAQSYADKIGGTVQAL
jgi:hypothetical protein